MREVHFAIWLALVTGVALVSGGCLGATAQAEPRLITFEELERITPDARDEFLQAIIDSEELFQAAGITTRLRMAHFLTQVMTETGGLKRLDENMNYSKGTLLRVFSRKVVSEAKAGEIAGNPEKVANWVYRGPRLGNGPPESGDGWNYRGSGYLQLTGRANFRDRGAQIGVPLEENPELARTVPKALEAAIAYWQAAGINAAADDHDSLRVRKLVNGPAAHGYEQSKVWFSRAWVRVFRDKEGQGFETSIEMAEERASVAAEAETEQQIFDEILTESGLITANELANEAGAAAARENALKSFQRELGLPESGVLDEATQDALLDPREWRHSEGEEVLADPVQTDPEQTVVIQFAAAATETATESAAPISLPSSQGTGTMVADPELPPEDLDAITGATGMYAEYETGVVPRELWKPFSVIEPDTRAAVIDTTGFPARAVVQIKFETSSGSGNLCTGALVSPDTVLTAAHCIHSGTVSGSAHRNFRLWPGRNLSVAPFGGCGVREAFVLSGWTTALFPNDARYYDLGALKLDCAVGEATGWFSVRALGDEEIGLPTVVHGYAADLVPPARQWKSEDRLEILWEFKGFYRNDTFGGTSGSPVYAANAPDAIIGVHTNGLHGTEQPWASFNAFTRITPERLARIQSWIGD